MVVRSIRQHVAAHNWFAVAVDVAIVVVGVFLGQQVSNWNEGRIERSVADNYRVEIIDNLRANIISLDDQIAYYEQVNAHAAAAHNAFENPAASLDEAFIIDNYQATQIRQRQLTGMAYDEMQNAGIGRLIGDARARALLSSYYAQLPQVNDNALVITGFRDKVRSAIPFQIQRQIVEKCDRTVNLPLGVVGAVLAKNCKLDLPPDEIARTNARLRAMPGIDLDLTRRIADVDARLGMLRSLRDRASTALTTLRARAS